MSTLAPVKAQSEIATEGRDVILTRDFDAAPELLYRAWTEPALVTQWLTLGTWKAVKTNMDVRPGGANLLTMRSADGSEFPNQDVYLDVVPNKRLVFTDAYTSAWIPSKKTFMTVTLTFDELGSGRTHYTARVSHWSVADREQHEQMGFRQNWQAMTEELAALVAKL